jgi:hypothetical protein
MYKDSGTDLQYYVNVVINITCYAGLGGNTISTGIYLSNEIKKRTAKSREAVPKTKMIIMRM